MLLVSAFLSLRMSRIFLDGLDFLVVEGGWEVVVWMGLGVSETILGGSVKEGASVIFVVVEGGMVGVVWMVLIGLDVSGKLVGGDVGMLVASGLKEEVWMFVVSVAGSSTLLDESV